jgi:hypothetical protein
VAALDHEPASDHRPRETTNAVRPSAALDLNGPARLRLLRLLLLLLPLQLLLLFPGHVMTNSTAGRGAQHSVMTGNMSRYGTDCRAFEAPFCSGALSAGEQGDSKHGHGQCMHSVRRHGTLQERSLCDLNGPPVGSGEQACVCSSAADKSRYVDVKWSVSAFCLAELYYSVACRDVTAELEV